MKIIITENQLKFLLEEEIKDFKKLKQKPTCTTKPSNKHELPPCRSFEDAKKWAYEVAFKQYGINSTRKWNEYFDLYPDKRPFDIPKDPVSTYKTTWSNFLDIGFIPHKERAKIFWSYEKAKEFMANYPTVSSDTIFRTWYKENKDKIKELKFIPASPQWFYRKDKFSYGDFLGSGRMSNQERNKYLQTDDNFLKELFKSDTFKNLYSFTEKEFRNLNLEDQEKILNNTCNDRFKEFIPDGYYPRYCYDKVVFKNMGKNILIGCKLHYDFNFGTGEMGYFNVIPDKLRGSGTGCPECSSKGDSKGEKNIKSILDNLEINYINPKGKSKISGCVGGTRGNCELKFDFKLLDEYEDIYVEFDGEYHFASRNSEQKIQLLNYIKNDHARNEYFIKNKNLKLIRISYAKVNQVDKILTKDLLDKVKNSQGGKIFTCPYPYTPINEKYQDFIEEKGFKLYGNGTILNPRNSQSICP